MSLTLSCLVGNIPVANFNTNKHLFLPDLPVLITNFSKPQDSFSKSGLSDF